MRTGSNFFIETMIKQFLALENYKLTYVPYYISRRLFLTLLIHYIQARQKNGAAPIDTGVLHNLIASEPNSKYGEILPDYAKKLRKTMDDLTVVITTYYNWVQSKNQSGKKSAFTTSADIVDLKELFINNLTILQKTVC